ncbi:hypothetical protein SUDANB121_02991 [Nocardiopsis dassonvillei]|uniref:CPBP family intramembrane glutamic endopeptidase n=1 Tax=Nocardiopsis dassonvillei TaxID=2014 RepID=UPI003F5719C4
MPSTTRRPTALAFAVAVTVARFLLISLALAVAPLIGITGWYMGLFANAVCTVFAVVLVTWLGLWRASGLLTLWRSPRAALLVLPFAAEALLWLLAPGGLVERPPGFGLWALTLLLVGLNEELVSRVVVLRTLSGAFSSVWAVVLTAALFGLQHLSQFAVTDRSAEEILWNVLLSAVVGFAYAAFQMRFSWLWPLVLCHAGHDFTRILAGQEAPDSWYAVVHVLLLSLGILLLVDERRAGGPASGGGRSGDSASSRARPETGATPEGAHPRPAAPREPGGPATDPA